MSEEPPQTNSCPFCGEAFAPGADACPHCNENLRSVPSLEETRARLARKELELRAALASGRYDALPRREGGRLRKSTLLFALLAVACFAAAVYFYRLPGDWSGAYFRLLCAFGAVLTVPFLLFLGQDLAVPAPAGRTTPLRGLRGFICALTTARYRYAYDCLAPGERDALTRRQPTIEEFGVFGRHYEFDRLEGFRRYWKALVRPATKLVRQLSWVRAGDFQVEKQVGEFALVSCEMKVWLWDERISAEEFPLFKIVPLSLLLTVINLFLPRRRSMRLCKLLRRIDGQWCPLNGEIESPEDGAFDEAVGISKLGDAELAGLAGLQS